MAVQLSVKTRSPRLTFLHELLFFPHEQLLLILSEKVELIKWWYNSAADRTPPPKKNTRMRQLHSIICKQHLELGVCNTNLLRRQLKFKKAVTYANKVGFLTPETSRNLSVYDVG